MERKLASVRRIADLFPIPGADRIEAAAVGGWRVVVPNGAFALGDLVAYFEIDSMLPLEHPAFAHLAPRGEKLVDGERVHILRTAKLRGQVSQGLIVDLADLGMDPGSVADGDDLTERLGIRKWEPPIPVGSDILGPFPSRLQKTDAERVQNLYDDDLAALAGLPWEATVKIDGMSITMWRDGEPRLATRNWEVAWDEGSPRDAILRPLADLLADGEAVQGELYGPGINGNRQRATSAAFAVFAFWRGGERLPRAEWPAWAARIAVPTLDLPFPETVAEAIAQADGLRGQASRHHGSNAAPDALDEGIVWHEQTGTADIDGRPAFKAISNRYLLKHGE